MTSVMEAVGYAIMWVAVAFWSVVFALALVLTVVVAWHEQAARWRARHPRPVDTTRDLLPGERPVSTLIEADLRYMLALNSAERPAHTWDWRGL